VSARAEHAGSVALRFGPVVVRFHAEDPELRFIVRPPHTAFVVPRDISAACDVACRLEAPSSRDDQASFSPPEGDWALYSDSDGGDEMRYLAPGPGGARVPRLAIRLSPDLAESRLSLRPRSPDDRELAIDFPLDEYLATRLLSRRGHVVLHGCTLAEGEDGFVFVGHSGAGKSTIAELGESVSAEVLSDDRTILTLEGDSVRAWGTPWHGSLTRGEPRSALVRGIFLLVQDSTDEVRPLHPATAFGELFVRTVQPTIAPDEVRRLLDVLERIVAVAPVSALHFRPTAEAYLLARKCVAALAPVG
jgi:hypothetical protein